MNKMAKTSSIFSIGDDEAVEALEEDFLLDFDDGKVAPQVQTGDFNNQQIKKFNQYAKGDVKFKFKANSAVNSFLKPRPESSVGTQNGFLPQSQSNPKLRLPGGERKLDHGGTVASSSQFKNTSDSSVNRRNYLSSLGNLCNKTAGDLSSHNGNHFGSADQNAGVQRPDLKSPPQTNMPTQLNSLMTKPPEGQENVCGMQKEPGSSLVRNGRGLSSHQFHPPVKKQDSANSFQRYLPPPHDLQLPMQCSNTSSANALTAYKSGNYEGSHGKFEDQSGSPGSTDTLKIPSSVPVVQRQAASAGSMNEKSSSSQTTSTGGQFKKSSHIVSNRDATAISPANVSFRTWRTMSPGQKTDSKHGSAHLAEPQLSVESPSVDKHGLDTTSSHNLGLRAIPNVQPRVSSTGQFQKMNSIEPLPAPQAAPSHQGSPAPLAAPSHQGSSSFIPAVRPSTPNNNAPFSQFQKRNPGGINRIHTPPRHPGVPGWNSPRPLNGTPYHGQRYDGSTRMRTPQVPQGDQFPSPQAPVLTPRVAQLCKTPTGPGKGHTTRSSRKFPGPAGILPKLAPGQNLSNINLSPPLEEETGRKEKEDASISQDSSLDDFSQGAWATMKIEMDFDEKDSKAVLAQHNIASVLRRASMRQLQKNKVPHICVMIKLITIHTNDATVTFKDPTGEMQGTLHRQLLEEYQSDLKPGCVLLLKQVGVLSPSLRNHYLNVTHRNVVQIFPSQHISSQKSPTSQPAKKSSPKSIKVNKHEFQGNSASPESSESRVKFVTERGEENIEKQRMNSSSFVSRTNDVTISLGDRGSDSVSGQFQKKRTSDEAVHNSTKRQCLQNVGENEIQKGNVSPKEEVRRSETDTSSLVHVLPSEESIAELIDGFEEELLADF
ncbi:hypothetical protein HOLleu_35517 [Holothuria leucospilota]|uniref:Homologous recombination OB-fold protein OB-fold domain-containing protein n=1 Tax=Holothuria leucospilota TaxID=206669 RepID=A0A9Q0YPU7_HOLLE|nr:hypothetical protein HOLleu_35517 [Holothuria leucospilota]